MNEKNANVIQCTQCLAVTNEGKGCAQDGCPVAEQKKGRLRWRKGKTDIWNGPTVYEFTDGVTIHARVQSHRAAGWFWYGMGQNTAGEAPLSLDDAKEQAAKHVRAASGVEGKTNG